MKVLDATQAADLSAALDGFGTGPRVEFERQGVAQEEVGGTTGGRSRTLDDGGLFEALDTLPDKFAIQSTASRKIRNACKKARIKAGGDLEQCTARLLKIREEARGAPLDPAFGLIPTRNNRRNARWNWRTGKSRRDCAPASTSTSASRTDAVLRRALEVLLALIVPSFSVRVVQRHADPVVALGVVHGAEEFDHALRPSRHSTRSPSWRPRLRGRLGAAAGAGGGRVAAGYGPLLFLAAAPGFLALGGRPRRPTEAHHLC